MICNVISKEVRKNVKIKYTATFPEQSMKQITNEVLLEVD